ncbi:MAG: hypothetical protein K5695_07720 [Oscillospiraceae bacterium]|nr:hypothetical protein [Oscillospiraceae bacterium]
MQEQKTTRFVTPFGHIEVLKNGELMPFGITDKVPGAKKMPVDDTLISPDGLYGVVVPLVGTVPGDTITVRYSVGKLEQFGGKDPLPNALCVENGYVFGFGWEKTDKLEQVCRAVDPELFADRERVISYENLGITGSGVAFRITDGAEMNRGVPALFSPMLREIRVTAAWSATSSPHAEEVVAFVTF